MRLRRCPGVPLEGLVVWAVPPVVVRRRLDYRPFCTLQPAPSVIAAAPLAVTLPVELSAADRARVDAALRDSRAANTRAQYRSAWRGWAEWSALNGHATLPADPLTVAAYLPWTGQHQHTTPPPPRCRLSRSAMRRSSSSPWAHLRPALCSLQSSTTAPRSREVLRELER